MHGDSLEQQTRNSLRLEVDKKSQQPPGTASSAAFSQIVKHPEESTFKNTK
jgi:hypothetical protein